MGKRSAKTETQASDNRFGNQRFADGALNTIIAGVEYQMNEFTKTGKAGSGMTGRERQRLYGAGVRNYGFIVEAWNIARENPAFMPPFFMGEQFGSDIRELEQMRQLDLALEQFKDAVNKSLLVKSDKCYREALRVYGSLKEQSRNKVAGAEVFHAALRIFFRRSKKSGEGEPSEKELERDFKRLLHGKADGTIEVVNETPKAKARKRKVVDRAGGFDDAL